MAYGPNGDRTSRTAQCVQHAGIHHLINHEAGSIVAHQIEVIRRDWDEVCDLAELTTADRDQLWQRQFLNPFALNR